MTFSSNFYRQTDRCTMSRSLPVTFSDKYKVKTASDIVAPLKIKFYRRYADDILGSKKCSGYSFQKAQQLSSNHQSYH